MTTENPWGPRITRSGTDNNKPLAVALARKLGLPTDLEFDTPDAVCDYVRGRLETYDIEVRALQDRVNELQIGVDKPSL